MEKQTRPHETPEDLYHRETHCQSCGRFVGTYERCPYCQAATPKRLSVRVFKILSVLTSTVGLLMLLFYARTIQTPIVSIDSLGPLSNFAHVRIVGTVDRSFGIHPEWQSLSFIIAQKGKNDEPVTIRISAYSKVAVGIKDLNQVPNEGDQVSVEGTVRFQKEAPSLLINAPEHIKILTRAKKAEEETIEREPQEVTKDLVGKQVSVKGVIAESIGFPRGFLIRLEDGKKGFPVWVPTRIWEDMKIKVNPGFEIRASGKVKPFKDDIELEVTSAEALSIISSSVRDLPKPLPAEGRETSGDGETGAGASPTAGTEIKPPPPTPVPSTAAPAASMAEAISGTSTPILENGK